MTEQHREITKEVWSKSFVLFLLEIWRISSGENRGDKYSFKERPFLYEIALDSFHRQVTQKSAQCGISEIKIAKAIWKLLSTRGNSLYAFPALQQLRQFVGARVRPSIEVNPEIYKYVSGAMNLEQIQIGDNTMYFTGVQNRRQMISKDVSSLFVDELDTAVLEARNTGFGNVVYTLEKRLGAAKNPIYDYFSTPSYSGMGINAEYAGDDTNPGSDQREWLVKCHKCGAEQELTWDENVIDKNEDKTSSEAYAPDAHRICAFCHDEFSPEDIMSGRFVPKKPALSNVCHGYHISKLMLPDPHLNQMMLDSRNPIKEQEFRCSDLGIPFEPKGSKLTDDILELARNSSKHLMQYRSENSCYFGCDVGKVLHVQVGERTADKKIKVIWAGELKTWDELGSLMTRYNMRMGVIDAQPGVLDQREFCKKFGGKVLMAYYPAYIEQGQELFKDRDEITLHVNRTMAMSMVIQAFFNNGVFLPIDVRGVRDYYKMMKSPVRATQEDQTGNMRTYFPPTSVADHYFHAFVYLMVAMEKRPRDIIFIPSGVHY